MSASQDPLLVQRLMRSLLQLNRQFRYRKCDGVKSSLLKILLHLGRCSADGTGKATVSQLSKMLQVTSPTVTQQISELEHKGWVKRELNLDDRRVVHVMLTDAGREVLFKSRHKFMESIEGLINHLGPEKSRQLSDLLDETFRYFEHRQKHLEGEKND